MRPRAPLGGAADKGPLYGTGRPCPRAYRPTSDARLRASTRTERMLSREGKDGREARAPSLRCRLGLAAGTCRTLRSVPPPTREEIMPADGDRADKDDGRVLESGWQKLVAPPDAATRPAGLPPKPQPSPPAKDKE